ncbi:MAG: hypothetical protein ACTSUT_08265 [Promethearchaeota archaeon]
MSAIGMSHAETCVETFLLHYFSLACIWVLWGMPPDLYIKPTRLPCAWQWYQP